MQTEWVINNPQASMPLRVQLEVECNTPKERILANVLKNSRHVKKWVQSLPAHDGVAILCGGGPSIADTIDEIKAIRGKVFALNGAATFLSGNGIKPDYQVIMDAKPESVSLIGPAKNYLFASQVDPKCFRKKPQAVLWHATHGTTLVDEQDGFPAHEGGYAIVGGAVSVGNTALVLLYALGYRTIHVFGMDSSHRDGSGHAYRQAMNDGDPCTIVEHGGKEYVCSLAMSLQAKYFMSRSAMLKAAGCSIMVYGSGLLPDMYNAAPLAEDEKYRLMWAHPDYRRVSPGELSADRFLELVKPGYGTVIDFGCGTGRGALRIAGQGHRLILLDFADNCRDEEAKFLPFKEVDLTKPFQVLGDYGYCTDVMEHIPTHDVGIVIHNIMRAAPVVYFQISTVPDSMGALIGHDLHLTVKPHEWWLEVLSSKYRVRWHEAGEIASTFIVEK